MGDMGHLKRRTWLSLDSEQPVLFLLRNAIGVDPVAICQLSLLEIGIPRMPPDDVMKYLAK